MIFSAFEINKNKNIKMKAELKTITPTWARRVLDEKNIGNRAMNKLHVDSLAKEMACGRWKVNGDTICINESRLIDGQHRLAAVVLSGVTIQSFVVEGLPCDVFDTKDVGKRRSGGDTLGIRGEKNAYRLAAVLALVDKYVTGRADKQVVYTNTEIEELLEKYPEARASVSGTKTNGIITPSVLDACHYIFSRIDRRLADEFVEKIVRGTGLEYGSPWYVLRERLMQNNMSKAKLSKYYLMALCIKSWNYARNEKSVRCLKWNEDGNESFPIAK